MTLWGEHGGDHDTRDTPVIPVKVFLNKSYFLRYTLSALW